MVRSQLVGQETFGPIWGEVGRPGPNVAFSPGSCSCHVTVTMFPVPACVRDGRDLRHCVGRFSVVRPDGGQSLRGWCLFRAVRFKEPLASAGLIERDVNGRAEIPIVLEETSKDVKLIDARLNGPNPGLMGVKFVDGQAGRRSVGAPGLVPLQDRYGLAFRPKTTVAGPAFGGADLWVPAGQSNLEGVGKL